VSAYQDSLARHKLGAALLPALKAIYTADDTWDCANANLFELLPAVWTGSWSTAFVVDEPHRIFASTQDHPIVLATMKARVHESELLERQRAAVEFANRATHLPAVRDVLVTELEPDLVVTAVLAEEDVVVELELHAMFIDVVRRTGDSSVGELRVRTLTDEPVGVSLIG
jgi:hypothetical protein